MIKKKVTKKVVKSVKLSKPVGTKYVPEMSKVSSSFDKVEIKNTISKLEIDLGRDDLNLLKDKINEVIEYVSKPI